MTTELPLGIDVQTVKAMLDAGQPFCLLDCREPDEHQLARIEGAELIPMGQLPSRLAELDAFRAGRLVVHCHHGGRSLRVANWLRAQGFGQAQTMEGGIDAWAQFIDTRVPRY
jgi:adenylyltransferase/sulfurtransferase